MNDANLISLRRVRENLQQFSVRKTTQWWIIWLSPVS